MDPLATEIFGGMANLYVEDFNSNLQPPPIIPPLKVSDPGPQGTNRGPYRAYPPTLDSGLFFSTIIPNQIYTMPVWALALYMIVLMVFLFTAGEYFNIRQVLAQYIRNPFFMMVPLIAFVFLWTGLSNAIAIGMFVLALLVVNNQTHPIVKVLLLIVSIGHMILNSYRTPDIFSDYDIGFIVIYLLLLIPVYFANNRYVGIYHSHSMEPILTFKAGAGNEAEERPRFNSVWSMVSEPLTQS